MIHSKHAVSSSVVVLVVILLIVDVGAFYAGVTISKQNVSTSTITSTTATTSIQTSTSTSTTTSSTTITSNEVVTSTVVSTATTTLTPTIPIGAYYYAWYGLPADTHWSNRACTITNDTPVLGRYESLNSSVIQWQVKEAQSAGISFFIVSWWGPSTDNTTGNGQINFAAQNFFKVLSSMHTNFKAAIMIDGYNSSLDYNGYLSLYNYVYSNFVQPYNSNYFYFDGKPLITIFNTPNQESEHPPSSNMFTIETLGNTPNPVDWLLWGVGNISHPSSGVTVIDKPENFTPAIGSGGYVSVTPRFDDSLLYHSGCRSGALLLDQNYTLGLYQSQWNYVLSHRNNVSIVVIYSWNEYLERSFIEPAISYTTPTQSPYYLLDLTSNFTSELNPG